jgi:hypothetical protein
MRVRADAACRIVLFEEAGARVALLDLREMRHSAHQGRRRALAQAHHPPDDRRFAVVESAAARDMIDRYCERYGRQPKGVAADNTYGNGEMLQWLDDRGITPYIRVKEVRTRPLIYTGSRSLVTWRKKTAISAPPASH